MKHSKNELDVDFIGGLEPLTKEDEKAISEFIKVFKEHKQKQKALTAKKSIAASGARTPKVTNRRKVNELNKSKAPLVIIDPTLDKYRDKILFPKKLARANKMLKTAKLSPNKHRS